MITPLLAAALHKAVARLVAAGIAESWSGSRDPLKRRELSDELLEANQHYGAFVAGLTVGPLPTRRVDITSAFVYLIQWVDPKTREIDRTSLSSDDLNTAIRQAELIHATGVLMLTVSNAKTGAILWEPPANPELQPGE